MSANFTHRRGEWISGIAWGRRRSWQGCRRAPWRLAAERRASWKMRLVPRASPPNGQDDAPKNHIRFAQCAA